MPLTFHIPVPLRDLTDGRSKVEIAQQPATLADALHILWELYPGVRDRITTEQGQIRQHVNIFIGDEDIRYLGGLASPISAHSEIWIVPAITGGSTPGSAGSPAAMLTMDRRCEIDGGHLVYSTLCADMDVPGDCDRPG